MNQVDIMMLGHFARDRLVVDGRSEYASGGAVYYGSIAPDISIYVLKRKNWPNGFEDTHHNFIDLRTYAFGASQKAFARGWLTHNEIYGADYFAHIEYAMGYMLNAICKKMRGVSSRIATPVSLSLTMELLSTVELLPEFVGRITHRGYAILDGHFSRHGLRHEVGTWIHPFAVEW